MICVTDTSLNPPGPVHVVFTMTGTLTTADSAELKFTLQVRVTADPTGCMGFELLLVTTTSGFGTEFERRKYETDETVAILLCTYYTLY